MFGNFQQMAALAGLMKDKSKLEASAVRLKAALATARETGESGGGACRVTVTGEMKVETVHIEPALASGLADESSSAYAEQLIADATNDAMNRMKATVQSIIREEMRGLGLESLFDDMSSMGPLGQLMG